MPSEHRAVLLLLALALGGQGVRYLLTRPGEAPGAVHVLGDGGSPAAHRDTILRRAQPLAPGERIDLDAASAKEIERLPRVGPGLARKIIAERAARGAFGSLQGLDRVPGVGRGLLQAIAAHVRFSGRRTGGVGGADGIDGTDGTDGTDGGRSGSVASVDSVDSVGSVNLNTASPTSLQRLPGIGPAKAKAIVAYREAHGPFASIEALAAVPGIGPSIVKRINGLATVE